MTKHLKANMNRLLDTPSAREWEALGACVGEDPELFYVPGLPDRWEAPQHAQQIKVVRRICAACPVKDLCAADAESDLFGFRAGLTPSEREELRDKEKQEARRLRAAERRSHVRAAARAKVAG